MSDLIERLKNKLSYYIYKTVNDDDANKYIEQKKQTELQVESQPEINNTVSSVTDSTDNTSLRIKGIIDQVWKSVKQPLEQKPDVQEQYDDTDKSAESKGLSITRILNKVWTFAVTFFNNYFMSVILPCILASLVANDLIMYPVMIRLIFFIFVFFICANSVLNTYGISLFYIGRKLYERYGINKKLYTACAEAKPPKIAEQQPEFVKITPTYFVFLPLFVKNLNEEEPWYSFVTNRFTYLKDTGNVPSNSNNNMNANTKVSKKQADILQTIMNKYTTSLSTSCNHYDETLASLFPKRKSAFDTFIKELHKQDPKKVTPEITNEAPQPSTIAESLTKTVQELAKTPEATGGPPEMSQAEKNKYKAEQKKIDNVKAPTPEASAPEASAPEASA